MKKILLALIIASIFSCNTAPEKTVSDDETKAVTPGTDMNINMSGYSATYFYVF